MGITRRQFLHAGAATWFTTGLLGAAGGSLAATAANSGQATKPTTGKTSVIGFDAYLAQHGYSQVEAKPLITGLAFNGGLRYDDDLEAVGVKTFQKQTVARVEDSSHKGRSGTLPVFTIIGLDTSTPALAKTATNLVLAYLINVVGLDPSRLRVTTTTKSSTFFPLLAHWGIGASQIQLRPWAAAVKAGSGSGYFAPAGHPQAPQVPSYSLEYVMPDGSELEIAEICHANGNGRSTGGIGVERVNMARTGKAMLWVDQLPQFNRLVQEEAARTGVALPPGVATINN